MKLTYTLLLLTGLPVSAFPQAPLATPHDLVGTWRCGPTVMQGLGFTITASEKIERTAAGTFVSHGTTVITRPDQNPLTLHDRSNGTWELADGIIKTYFLHTEFLSASDPSVTKEAGQKAHDDQLRKKSVYKTRVLGYAGTRYRTIPVNSMYKEAEVEGSCERA